MFPRCYSPRFLLAGRTLVLLACIVTVLALAGCRRKAADEPPVATPSFTLARDKVPIGSPVSITYKFEVAPDAAFEDDCWVFVHILDPDGELLWTDDHLPPTPTSQWKGGETIEYSRTVFVPNYPYIGEAIVRLGMYSQKSGRRLVLSGNEATRREYVVARFQLLPQSENVFLIYKDGWYPAEVAADNPAIEWQWMQKRGVIAFKNPKRDSTFYLEYDTRVDMFPVPQRVTIQAEDQVVATFAADARDKTLLTFPISAAQLGSGEMTELVIEVDRTFRPGGTDARELGIRVFHAFVEPK